MAEASKPSATTGSAPNRRRNPVLFAVCVKPTTECPARTRIATSGIPAAPVAPATNTRMRTSWDRFSCCGCFELPVARHLLPLAVAVALESCGAQTKRLGGDTANPQFHALRSNLEERSVRSILFRWKIDAVGVLPTPI